MSLTHTIVHGTEQHSKLRDYLLERVDFARQSLATTYARMIDDEKTYYGDISIPADEVPKGQDSGDDNGRPKYRTVSIPYSYAIGQTTHTYISSVFLSRSPVMRVEGRHGETQQAEQALEAVLDYQIVAGRARPVLYNWLLDPIRFGAGIVGCYWLEDISSIAKIEMINESTNPDVPQWKKSIIEKEVRKFIGNKLYNVRPIDFFYDARFSLMDFQKGEFAGELTQIPTSTADSYAARDMFIKQNVDKCKKGKENTVSERESGNENVLEDTLKNSDYIKHIKQLKGEHDQRYVINTIEIYVNLVPSDWGLSKSMKAQKYYFCIGEGEFILCARPMGCEHDMFPYGILPMEIDAYKRSSRSMINMQKDLEQIMTWLVNQHFYNVRKHLNNNAIIDPSKIVLKDLYRGAPGGAIRLRPEAYGSDVRLAYHQLEKTDITRSHFADIRYIEEVSQRLNGVSDNIMGLVDPGGRKTAQEIRTSSSFATNRQKVLAEWFSATGFSDLSRLMVTNTQQYLPQDMKFRIAGDLVNSSEGYLQINKDQIAGFYEFAPVDGTLPLDRMAIAMLMKDLFMQIVQMPPFASQYNLLGLFEYIGQLAGAKTIKRFRLDIASEDDLRKQIIAGNQVPINQGKETKPAGTMPSQQMLPQGQGVTQPEGPNVQ